MTTHKVGCRDCLQRFRGHDKRRRCRINGRITRLHRNADTLCGDFLLDVEKALRKARLPNAKVSEGENER